MRIIAFVNPGSGGNEGARVLEYLKNELGDENVFDIVADKGPLRGLEERASDASFEVRVIIAGGDGTFSWVADFVEKRNMSHVRLIIIPLGSGNDMSRALGWGIKYSGMKKLSLYTKHIQQARAHKLDVWRLAAVNDGRIPMDDEGGVSHGARPLMCNYLSLGADAYVTLKFNKLRWDNPDKYKSRIGNFRANVMVASKYVCGPPSRKIHVSDHIETLLIDDEPLEIPPKLQALIFLNIPSYGAGSQPWGMLGNTRPADVNNKRTVGDMYVDDHLFEVIGLKSLTQFGWIRTFGAHGLRLAQGKRMSMTLKTDSTPFQVDGEPWEQLGGTVSMEPGNRVGVLEGFSWSSQSKKNAKFMPGQDAETVAPHAEEPVVDSETIVPPGHQ